MSDNPKHDNKIDAVNEPRKGKWPTIGFRAHPDTVHRYDVAALALRVKRSEFLHRAAEELADRVLRADPPPDTRKGERRKGERRDPFAEGRAA